MNVWLQILVAFAGWTVLSLLVGSLVGKTLRFLSSSPEPPKAGARPSVGPPLAVASRTSGGKRETA